MVNESNDKDAFKRMDHTFQLQFTPCSKLIQFIKVYMQHFQGFPKPAKCIFFHEICVCYKPSHIEETLRSCHANKWFLYQEAMVSLSNCWVKP